MHTVGSRFEVRAQQLCGSGPRSPEQWICRELVTRTGFWCVNDDHQGISHGPNLIKRISPRQNPKSFSWCFRCVGDPSPPICFSLLPFYSRFPPPDWGPQGRYLSHPPLPPVVGSGCKDREVWLCQAQGTEYNKGCLPLYAFVLSVVFLHFRAFPALWNGLEFRHWWSVTSFTLGYIHPRRIFPWPRRGFSMDWAPGPV